MVVQAGTCEPVSALAFPANRELIREFYTHRRFVAGQVANSAQRTRDLDAIPCEHEQGIFENRSGKLVKRTRIYNAANSLLMHRVTPSRSVGIGRLIGCPLMIGDAHTPAPLSTPFRLKTTFIP